MANVKFNLRALKFDSKGWTKEFERKMSDLTRRAAGEWMMAVLTRVPVRTGMAAANLLPLGRYLSSRIGIPLDELIHIEPVDEPVRIYLGVGASSPPETMFHSTGKGTFYFKFNIGVYHYWLNEYFDMGPYKHPIDPNIQPPWGSMEVGEEAFFRYVHEHAPQAVPRIHKFLLTSKNDAEGV